MNYFTVTEAPTSKAAFKASASSLETASLTGAGAPSTTALASFKLQASCFTNCFDNFNF